MIREAASSDWPWLRDRLRDDWGSTTMVLDGVERNLLGLPALIADPHAGYLIYESVDAFIEILALQAVVPGHGIGSALLGELMTHGRRLIAVTTNDNTPAIRFYERHGFSVTEVRKDAVVRSRQLKPEIPLAGPDGVPIRDEIVLERTARG